ncbi:hypothetical protein GCM10023318_35600 [Nocardia callitridis]|uniref:DUF1772 domain-containing protein n=1 Tax=Nocardia callitridis TaxID=648753 RepID=A0ABP9KHJ2_9NOCA
MNTPHARTSPRWSAAWGVGAGFLIALFAFIPGAFHLQHVMDVPPINPTPAHIRSKPPEVATSYWISWGIALGVLLAPTLILAVIPRTRRVAIGYLLAAAIIGGGFTAAVISFELGGFSPD